jgi:hypothetical protein
MIGIALWLGAAGCGSGSSDSPGSSDAGGADQPLPPPDPDSDYVFPDTAYTGYDGTNTFKVPLSTSLTGDVTWEVEDPSILDVAPATAPPEYEEYGATWAIATTKKAGTTKVTAVSGAKRLEATVVVAAYEPTVVAAGAMRYNQPADANAPQRTACASCHMLANGVDHSPLQMAFFADAEILSAITTGMYPDGYTLMGVNHAWNVTDPEKEGIVPYLRSLPPKGF